MANDVTDDAGFVAGAVYRREAERLLRLAAATIYDDAKLKFLMLAQQYGALAAHAEAISHVP